MSKEWVRYLKANDLTPGQFYGLTDGRKLVVHQEWLRTRDRDRILGLWPYLLFAIVVAGVCTIWGQIWH